MEQVSTVGIDWWDRLKPFRMGTKGKKVLQYFKPIPELVDEFGVLFATATEAADGWVKSLAATEGGTVTTASQSVDIIMREAGIHLANQSSGPITDFI